VQAEKRKQVSIQYQVYAPDVTALLGIMTTEGSEDVYQVNFNRKKKQKSKSFYNARRSVAMGKKDSVEVFQSPYMPAQSLQDAE